MPSINYESWIRSAMANGMSPDEIAKNFTAAMNAINSKENEKKQAEQEKQRYYDRMDATLSNYRSNALSINQIAEAIVIMFWDKNRFEDWPLDKIKSYCAFVENFVASSADTFDQLENLSDSLAEFGKIFEVDISPVDLGDKELFDIDASFKAAPNNAGLNLDRATIDRFLKRFCK